jgi:hypothetical protein
VSALLSNGSFGQTFPENCPDGYGIIGHDSRLFELMRRRSWISLNLSPRPSANRSRGRSTLTFVTTTCALTATRGLREFVDAINSIFARNGVAYELTEDGQAKRILSTELQQLFATTSSHSGDAEADRLLEEARADFTSSRENERRNTLEKLWDAFERIKTPEPGRDKRTQVTALLDKTAKGKYRVMLEAEATELTRIGNTFRIRHSETTQEPLVQSREADYLFHRMFSFLRLVLSATGRAN